MPLLRKGSTTTVELAAGEVISLTTGGTIVQITDGISSNGYDFTRWPVNLGPFTNAEMFTINATDADITYTVSRTDAYSVRLVKTLFADLPTIGVTGTIYQTEDGWFRWEDIDGTYKDTADAADIPLAPVNDTAPVIAGDDEVDAVIAVTSNGVWDNRPDAVFTYQWQISGVDVDGATGSTLVVPEAAVGEDITCDVTATNAVGSTMAVSNFISIPGE
jgi:hypothetical protein